jgi:hypothetical protein
MNQRFSKRCLIEPARLAKACAHGLRSKHAFVAQLDRAPGFEPGGQGFESLRAHQLHLASVESVRLHFSRRTQAPKDRRANASGCEGLLSANLGLAKC